MAGRPLLLTGVYFAVPVYTAARSAQPQVATPRRAAANFVAVRPARARQPCLLPPRCHPEPRGQAAKPAAHHASLTHHFPLPRDPACAWLCSFVRHQLSYPHYCGSALHRSTQHFADSYSPDLHLLATGCQPVMAVGGSPLRQTPSPLRGRAFSYCVRLAVAWLLRLALWAYPLRVSSGKDSKNPRLPA
jgi:hypothetical protein